MKQVLIISIAILASCTGGKKAVDNSKDSKELSAAETLKRIEAGELEYERLNANTELNISSEMFNGSVGAKLRIIRDSVVWMSASKLGFEVGRLMVTPDSVFVVERLQKTYIRESVDKLVDMAGFDLDFELLQDLLIGNPYLHPVDNDVIYYNEDSLVVIPAFDEYKITHSLRTNDFKLLKTTVRDEASKSTVIMSLGDYKTTEEGQIFSYFRDILLDENNGVSITYKNLELDTEKSVKFSIPPSYTPREL